MKQKTVILRFQINEQKEKEQFYREVKINPCAPLVWGSCGLVWFWVQPAKPINQSTNQPINQSTNKSNK